MQFSCSLFLRQWYDTRHESFVLQTPRKNSQQIKPIFLRFILYRVCLGFLFLKNDCNKY